LGRELAERRIAQNLTQEKLAAVTDVPIRTLQRAERGDGLSQESLDQVAMALGTDARQLLASAIARKEGSPELRLKLPEIRTGAELLAHVRRAKGVLQIGPEGEHSFNEHIGGSIIELADSTGTTAMDQADYLLQFSDHMGFRLFACHYQEELEHNGRMIRKPTTLIIAAPLSDPRIRKTAKGRILDYVMDRRKQLLHRVLKGHLTAYDWMEDQLISRSHGEEQVRAELQRIHREILAGDGASPNKAPVRSPRSRRPT